MVSSFEQSLDADAADPESERIILRVQQPYANHNGGAVVFGPDGMLYIALGDGGSGGDPQGNGRSLNTNLAKILRIDVDVPAGQTPAYTIPADNPFASGDRGALAEIWLTGLRNPWRMHFDPLNGDLWIGDVGQGAWEEIDVARAGVGGLDYGWNTMEGTHCYQPQSGCDQAGLTLPVSEYDHSLGCAVIGGVVARGDAEPSFAGWYFFSDDCSGNVWVIDPSKDAFQDPILDPRQRPEDQCLRRGRRRPRVPDRPGQRHPPAGGAAGRLTSVGDHAERDRHRDRDLRGPDGDGRAAVGGEGHPGGLGEREGWWPTAFDDVDDTRDPEVRGRGEHVGLRPGVGDRLGPSGCLGAAGIRDPERQAVEAGRARTGASRR